LGCSEPRNCHWKLMNDGIVVGKYDILSSKLPRVELDIGLFLPRSFSGRVLVTEPESIHDNIGQNVSLACHHAITDIVTVK